MTIPQIPIDDYNYELPETKIAKYPLPERDNSKLLLLHEHHVTEDRFFNIDKYIPQNSLMVFNDTKVVKARLLFHKTTGATIEILCLEPAMPADYTLSFAATDTCTWKCLIGNKKKWKGGTLSSETTIDEHKTVVAAEIVAEHDNHVEVRFSWNKPNTSFATILEALGKVPIPPYLNRPSEDSDTYRYQTVYSRFEGSVAAPTAGLHFTNKEFKKLDDKHIIRDFITLHVGPGTFKPVKTTNACQHEMHTEHFIVDKSLIINVLQHFGDITAVGTTTVRTLESLVVVAQKVYRNDDCTDNTFTVSQWEAYNSRDEIATPTLLENLLAWMSKRHFDRLYCSTQIMIVPLYNFRIINRLITNFHQPKSTLLLLLAAFIGDEWKMAYDFALSHDFRFLSYGDSCLFERKQH